MIKSWRVFFVLMFLFSTGAIHQLRAEDNPAAAPEENESSSAQEEVLDSVGDATAEETAIEVDATVDGRISALSSLSLDELRKVFSATEENLPVIAANAQSIESDLRELRINQQQHESVKAIRAEIAILQKKINEVIDELPEVKAKLDEATQAQSRLNDEMKFRARLMQLIAVKDREENAPEPSQTSGRNQF